MITQYILEIIVFQLAFLLIYEFWLQKETFFNLNRIYLLATPILSFLIPFIRIEGLQKSAPAVAFQEISANTTYWLPEVFIGKQAGTAQNDILMNFENHLNWWLVIYLCGSLIALGVFIFKLNRLFKVSRKSICISKSHYRIYQIPRSRAAFTFFNWLYIGEALSETEREQIMLHELVHLDHKHTADLLIFELLKILFWFNPLIYLFQSKLATLHEFIADESTVKTSGKKQYFEQLLNSTFGTSNISFTNQFFSHSLIKKRIIMLQKHKSSQLSKFKFLLLVPALLLMLTYVSCSEDQNMGIDEQEMSLSNQIVDLKAAIQNKENLTQEEFDLLKSLQKDYMKKVEVIEVSGKSKAQVYKDKIPFAVVDLAPAFPGCEQWVDDPRKNCTSSKIAEFVNENFDTSLGKKLGLTGINRVIVQFRIDETGKIVDVKARAPKPELEEEAIRVVSSLPQMTPGEQNGQPVSVMYSLPIAFKVAE
ncbi:blaR1 peptidase M56 [Christiangramia fulva]|uniref:BlaR1 peptidase M56 n=1 Tax=Christiangramia fulva TaxID=2126553 RepID=A0A2R3Z4P2_9FLAO|nr:M56 family metallopeptidase [Christiangramia fulva]AVR45204.1 blaR1 peptidase M56 [Christiangramia fulva]